MPASSYSEIDASPPSWGRRVVVGAVSMVLAAGVVFAVVGTSGSGSPLAKLSTLASESAHDPAAFAKVKSISYGSMTEAEKYSLFADFQTEYGRAYADADEEQYRYGVFVLNLDYIDALNTQNPHAVFGLNNFGDSSVEERKKRTMTNPAITNYTKVKSQLKKVLGDDLFARAEAGEFADGGGSAPAARKLQESAKKSETTWTDGLEFETGSETTFNMAQGEVGWASVSDCAACDRFPAFGEYDLGTVPDNFDWRELGAVTSVKNQAYCGSCWSFSTAADMEGTHFLATGILTDYSPQQLVECNTMNLGCDGGYPFAAMQYVSHFGGLVTWDDLPYANVYYGESSANPDGLGTPSCDKDLLNEAMDSKDVAHIAGWQMVAMGAEYESLMRVVLVKNGPLSISFNANGMDYYVHGVVGCTSEDDCGAGSVAHPDQDGSGDMFTCNPESLDHAVLIVGYGVQENADGSDVPYWVIKNSWASEWGEDGYYRLVRGSNACGVANMVSHSVVKTTVAATAR